MSPIIVRGLDEHVKQQLAAQAKEHGRSMEARFATSSRRPLDGRTSAWLFCLRHGCRWGRRVADSDAR